MGRVRGYIHINGKRFWTLFDTRARNMYIVPTVASHLDTTKLPKPFRSALGEKTRKMTTGALVKARVEKHDVFTHAMVVDEIGNDEEGKPIEVLFGTLAMQQ